MEFLLPLFVVGATLLTIAALDLLVYAALALTAVSTVYSYQQQQKAAKDQLKSGGVEITRQDSNAGLTIIYGERAIGGVKVWKDVNNTTFAINTGRTVFGQGNATDGIGKNFKLNAWLNRVDVLGQGPVHGITDIEIEDDSYLAPRFRKRNQAIYRGVFMNGEESQANLTELANNSDWKASSVGSGVAYMYSRFRSGHLDDNKIDRYYSAEPNMRYHLKGRLIWDPRDGAQSSSDPSTWQWSDNPALCLLDYLTQSYGRNLDYSQIDLQSFIDAANSCDISVTVPSTNNLTGAPLTVWDRELSEYVTIASGAPITGFRRHQTGTTQKRLTCNAALDPSTSVLENVKILLQSMRGTLPYYNGTYSLKLEDVEPTSMSFTEDDIIGGIRFAQGDRSKRYNRTTVVFKNRNKKYKEDRVSWPALDSVEYATLLAEDNNEELFYEIGLDAVTDYYQAEDLAEFITMSSREQLAAEMQVKSKGMLLEPSDVIEVTHETPGWSARKFRVRSVKFNTDQTVNLALTEYNAHIYTWRDTSQEPLQEDIGLSSPFDDKNPVTSLAATVSRVDTASGVPQGQVELSFTAPEGEQVSEYIVRFKPTGTAVWIENKYPPTQNEITDVATVSFLTPQHDTTYDLEVNYLDVAGISGESAVSSFTVPEYRTDLDLDLNTIETEVGEILEREVGGEFIPSDLSDLALYYKNSELTLQSNIDNVSTSLSGTDASVTALQSQLATDVATLQQDVADAESYTDTQTAILQGQVDGLNSTIGDITASTADVYLQATAPVAGVAGVPDPIPANSRWYDSDDANHPYVWDGTQWVSIKDGQTADNESRITDLEATVNHVDTGVTATATALDLLDTTVSDLDGDVSSISGAVTALESTVNDPTTGVSANASAIDSLQTLTTSQGATITSQSTAITELESRVDPTQTIYTDDAVSGNVPNNATISTALVTTASIATGGLVGSGYLSIQLTNANSTEDVRVGYNGVELGQFQSSGTDSDNQTLWFSVPVTVTDGAQTIEVWNTPASALAITLDAIVLAVGGLGDPATASATSGLNTRVTATEGGVSANAQDISDLQLTVDDPSTGVAVTASAVSGLVTDVAANTGGVSSNASAITALQTTVNHPDNGVSANAVAIGGLDTRVTSNEGQITSQASDITSLNADLDFRQQVSEEVGGIVRDENGDIIELENDISVMIAASSQADQLLDTRVTASEQTIESQSVDITNLQSRATNVETGVAGNASALTALTTRVTTNEGDITAQASDIAAIQADITDASTGLIANANALSGLTLRVTNTEGDIATNVQDIVALETAVADPATGLAANSAAITALDSRVGVNEGAIGAQSTDITALQNTVDNPTTGVAATSVALTALDSRVVATETAITSSSSDITTLQNQIAPASLVHSSGPIDELVSATTTNLTGLIYDFTPAGDVPLGNGYLHVLIDGADTDDDFRIGYNGTEIGGAQVESTQNNNSEQWFTFAVLTTTGQQTVTVWNPSASAGHVKGIILTYGGVGDPEGMFRGDANVAEIQANSSAVATLQSTVYEADGVTAAWSSDIVSLNNSITGVGGLDSRIDTLETADPDMVVFRQDAEPTSGLVNGALWVDTDDNNKLYVYNGTAWVAVDDGRISANSSAISTLQSDVYADDGVTAAWSADIVSLNNAISGTGGLDSRIGTLETADPDMVVFRQNDEPTTGLVTGALWVDTDDDNKLYVYDGTVWQAIDDVRISANSSAISTLQSDVYAADGVTAAWSADIVALNNSISGVGGLDSRIDTLETADPDMVVFRQDDEPTTGLVTGALWVDTDDDNKLYVYDGTVWQAIADARISANSSAISTLKSDVYAADGVTAAWSADIVALNNSISGTGGLDDRLGTLETADPDMVVFRQDDEPTTGLVTGALWVDTDDNNKLYVYDGTVWQAVDDSRISANSSAISTLQSDVYAADGVTAAWSADIVALNNSISGTGGIDDRLDTLETAPADMVVFNQAAQPTTDVVGALWIDSDDDNKLYTWDGTQWVDGTPQIDGMTVFYQNAQPTTDVVGALWFDADDNFAAYVWSGTAWESIQDPRIGTNATAVSTLQSAVFEEDGTTTAWSGDITALETTVNDPSTGVSATASAVSGLETRVTSTEGDITNLEAEYYVNLDVDGHVTGIRLYNTGVTSSFTVQADQFSVVAPGSSSTEAAPFSVDTSGTISMNASVTINGDLLVDGSITQTQMGNNSVGGDQIVNGSVGANELEISANPGGTGERMFFNGTDNRIEIFDASNVLRVALGDLTGV